MKEAATLAHRYSRNNKDYLRKSSICGCFFCLKIFSPKEITRYLNEGSGTAICPYCGIDSVIGDTCGFNISAEFLTEMQKLWF